jgi:MFS family permease
LNTVAGARQGVVLLAAAIMPVMAVVSLVPVLPLLLAEFGQVPGADYLVPMAVTVPALCIALLSPLAGLLIDRVGRKRLMVLALFCYALFGLIPWFMRELPALLAARVLLGATEAVIMTTATTLIADYFEGVQRERWISRQMVVVSLAAIALSGLGGGLGDAFGSRGPFLLYLLGLPIAAAAAVFLFEPERRSAVAAAASGVIGRSIFGLLGITFAISLVFYTLLVQLGPLLEEKLPATPGMIGIASAVLNLGMAIGAATFQWLKQHTGARLLTLGLLLSALGFTGAALAESFALVTAMATLAAVGSGLLLPNMLAWILRGLPASHRGRVTGGWTGAFFLGQFVAPLVATALLPIVGTLAKVLLIYAVGCVLAAVVALRHSRFQGAPL